MSDQACAKRLHAGKRVDTFIVATAADTWGAIGSMPIQHRICDLCKQLLLHHVMPVGSSVGRQPSCCPLTYSVSGHAQRTASKAAVSMCGIQCELLGNVEAADSWIGAVLRNQQVQDRHRAGPPPQASQAALLRRGPDCVSEWAAGTQGAADAAACTGTSFPQVLLRSSLLQMRGTSNAGMPHTDGAGSALCFNGACLMQLIMTPCVHLQRIVCKQVYRSMLTRVHA